MTNKRSIYNLYSAPGRAGVVGGLAIKSDVSDILVDF